MAPERKDDASRSSRRMVYRPGHPLAGKNGYLSAARFELYEKIGAGPHPCYWCGTSVNWEHGQRGVRNGTLITDHIDRDWRNDHPANLVAACASCNTFRSREARARVRPDELHIQVQGQKKRAIERQCETCGKTFLVPSAVMNRANRGRFCSLSCARRAPRKSRSRHCPTCTCHE